MDLLPQNPIEILMAGDFNCVEATDDFTGHRYGSKSLGKRTREQRLEDIWDKTLNAHACKHYTPTSAVRLDRIYATELIRKSKQGFSFCNCARFLIYIFLKKTNFLH